MFRRCGPGICNLHKRPHGSPVPDDDPGVRVESQLESLCRLIPVLVPRRFRCLVGAGLEFAKVIIAKLSLAELALFSSYSP